MESKQKACSEVNSVSSRELREDVSQETYQGTDDEEEELSLSTDDDDDAGKDDAGKDDAGKDDAGKDADASSSDDAIDRTYLLWRMIRELHKSRKHG